MCQPYQGTLDEAPEPMAAPSTANPSSSQPSSHGGKQPMRKQSRAARERASAGPSRPVYFHFILDQATVSRPQRSAGGEARWEEPDHPEIPKPHGLFMLAWKQADKVLERIKPNLVDPSYHFPKPMILVNVLTPVRKKTYLLNWLSACPLWINQVNICPLTKFLSPQMWRDFLNTIDADHLALTKSASMKLAVRNILGEHIIQSAQGLAGAPEEIMWQGIQVRVSSLSVPYF